MNGFQFLTLVNSVMIVIYFIFFYNIYSLFEQVRKHFNDHIMGKDEEKK
jgi:hypothetical protein